MGDAVLDDIKADMPGINVKPWDFSLDAAKEKKPRLVALTSRLIDYMAKQALARCPCPSFSTTCSSPVSRSCVRR